MADTRLSRRRIGAILNPVDREGTIVTEVVENPDIMSGTPTIDGTRVPAETVMAYLRAGHSRQDIFEDYPNLPLDGIDAVIRWAEGKYGEHWLTTPMGRPRRTPSGYATRMAAMEKRMAALEKSVEDILRRMPEGNELQENVAAVKTLHGQVREMRSAISAMKHRTK